MLKIYLFITFHLFSIVFSCYVFPKDSTDPCVNKQCEWGADCVRSVDGHNATCVCPEKCPNYGDHIDSRPICGSDGKDYPNLCYLKMNACHNKTNITIKYQGKCDPCSEVSCTEPEICQLNEKREPYCKCGETCSLEFVPVCGSDGRTYPNECALRQESCRSRKSLRIIYHGKCSSGVNPCLSVKCSANEECTINKFGIAECTCPTNCEPIVKPICSKGGRTFSSECEMKKTACEGRETIVMLHRGVCGEKNLCDNQTCHYGSVCIQKLNRTLCECPICSTEFNPVCGSDGVTYGNKCKLLLEACKHQRNVTLLYEGPCSGCENKRCDFYSMCESKASEAACVCPKSCDNEQNNGFSVCGSDGITYANSCLMRLASCKTKKHIHVAYKGDCDQCRGVKCKYGAECRAGMCVCPTDCHGAGIEPVCSSSMQTYPNECELQKAACKLPADSPPLNIAYYGECVKKEIPFATTQLTRTAMDANSVEYPACKDIYCDFDATCELGPDNFPRCTCKFDCNNTISAVNSKPVCASDLRLYPSLCAMKLESCQRQEELRLRPLDLCQGMKVKPCNGEAPLKHPVTGKELDCGSGPTRQDCPSGSYCHQTTLFAKCCMKVDSNAIQKTCENSWYGCCQDGKTASQGTNFEGCPFLCGCNRLGSQSDNCDEETKQCKCKPGVGGLKCDRCKPGYWGLPKISSGHQGCIPCGCSMFGSVREDCEQMTGRCVCKNGIQGQKCNICSDPNKVLGPTGCISVHATQVTATSCNEHLCYFDGICKEDNGQAICECNLQCPDAKENEKVCGSDDETYPSECILRLTACKLQKDIVVQAFGSCKDMKLLESKWQSQHYTTLSKTKKLRQSYSKTLRHVSNQQLHERKDTIFYLKNGELPTEMWKNNKIFKRHEPHIRSRKFGRRRKILLQNANHLR